MTIDYSSPGKVILSMIDSIGKILDDIPEDMKREKIHTCCTPPLWHCRRCNKTIPRRRRHLAPFCGTTTISFKEGTYRHPASSIIPLQ